MAKSAAQRQAEYRARLTQGEGTDERLNTLVTVQAKRALERLATCYGVPGYAAGSRVRRAHRSLNRRAWRALRSPGPLSGARAASPA
jgi:hypothetical protein